MQEWTENTWNAKCRKHIDFVPKNKLARTLRAWIRFNENVFSCNAHCAVTSAMEFVRHFVAAAFDATCRDEPIFASVLLSTVILVAPARWKQFKK